MSSEDKNMLVGFAVGIGVTIFVMVLVLNAGSSKNTNDAAPYIDKVVAGEAVNFIKLAELIHNENQLEQAANRWCDRNGITEELQKADKVQEIKALLAYQLVVANRADLPAEKPAE